MDTIKSDAAPVAAVPVFNNLEPLLLTIPETSHVLRRSPSIIWQKIAAKELDARRDGKRTLITMASVKQCAANLPPREPGRWRGGPKPQRTSKPKRQRKAR